MSNTSPQRPRPSQKRIEAIVAAIATQTGVPAETIRAKPVTRAKPAVTAARWLAWRQLCEVEGFGLSPTALAWGCHHASILHAKRKGWEPAQMGSRQSHDRRTA